MAGLATILRRAKIGTSSLQTLADPMTVPIYYLARRGSQALDTWQRLRDLVPLSGHWPVLLGDDDDLEMIRDNWEEPQRPAAEVLQEAEVLAQDPNPRAWFYRQLRAEMDEPLTDADLAPEGSDWPIGSWPRHHVRTSDDIGTPYESGGGPKPRVHIALVPTRTTWHVPVLLNFGNFNACPAPVEHAAMLKHWHEKYGAEVVSMTHDVIETRVARPPKTRAAALALAKQQYAYCSDIVSQGVETLSRLAACLLNGHAWYFWWD
jgi:hypothetical protein